jgi:hypothetical protein
VAALPIGLGTGEVSPSERGACLELVPPASDGAQHQAWGSSLAVAGYRYARLRPSTLGLVMEGMTGGQPVANA